MPEIKRLDGTHARQLEVLTGIADDLAAAVAFIQRVLRGERRDSFPWWTSALISYGRCFGKGVPPWGAGEAIHSLSQQLQCRHRHFRRLRDTLVSHPAGIDHIYRTEVIVERSGARRIQCSKTSMFHLGTLEAMDFSELLQALQTFAERRLIEVRNELQLDVAQLSDEELQQLPAIEPCDGLQYLAVSANLLQTRLEAY